MLCEAHQKERDYQEQLGDYHAGLIAAVIANCSGNIKHSRTFQPVDFMPKRKEKPKNVHELKQTAEQLNNNFGGNNG